MPRLRSLCSIEGRISRQQFWKRSAVLVGMYFVMVAFKRFDYVPQTDTNMLDKLLLAAWVIVFYVALILFLIAGIKRLHDMNFSGVYLFILPFLFTALALLLDWLGLSGSHDWIKRNSGFLFLPTILWLGFVPGMVGSNRFGPATSQI